MLRNSLPSRVFLKLYTGGRVAFELPWELSHVPFKDDDFPAETPRGPWPIVTPGSHHKTAPLPGDFRDRSAHAGGFGRGFPASRYVGDRLRMGVQFTPTRFQVGGFAIVYKGLTVGIVHDSPNIGHVLKPIMVITGFQWIQGICWLPQS